MTKCREFDAANYLKDAETVHHYLADAAAEDEADALLEAWEDVARAHGTPVSLCYVILLPAVCY
ncbi:hypothetical protein ACFZAI_02320 [Achromobacter sp. NPDC008082]|uniref:hypothetical protein n=1 Tax=Achromobacter sp. NPDC008082 TaxID=3363888 RepID=UPI0036E000D0